MKSRNSVAVSQYLQPFLPSSVSSQPLPIVMFFLNAG